MAEDVVGGTDDAVTRGLELAGDGQGDDRIVIHQQDDHDVLRTDQHLLRA